jgi:cytosine/adenosine deaminase-related metal-dependent hydrolase
MPSFTARWILTPHGFKSGHTIVLEEDGTIDAVHDSVLPDAQVLEGILCPGFVNAHCHLELSALKGMVPPGTGMAAFIDQLQISRKAIGAAQAENAVNAAIDEAYETGTDAIADIANTEDSFLAKTTEKRLRIYTFVERFGLNPADAEKHLKQGKELVLQCAEPASLTPHAPYSVSQELFSLLYRNALTQRTRLSLHLLESNDERQLLETRTGALKALYDKWNITFQSEYNTVLQHALRGLDKSARILFVHLTVATPQELAQLAAGFPNAYFCLCPRSNQYIHNRLPDFSHFDFAGDRLCIGTDSLASNTSLNMLEELKLIQQKHPAATTQNLLQCATRNGAAFLGFDGFVGSFTPGSKPGLVNITGVDAEARLTPAAQAARVIAPPAQ